MELTPWPIVGDCLAASLSGSMEACSEGLAALMLVTQRVRDIACRGGDSKGGMHGCLYDERRGGGELVP
jgi:hypothetical protein